MRKLGLCLSIFIVIMMVAGSVNAINIMGGKVFSIDVEITQFAPNIENEEMTVVARVCPPVFFGSMFGGSELQPKLIQAVGVKVNAWRRANPGYVVRRSGFSAVHETSFIRSIISEGKPGNRCTVGTSYYNIIPKKNASVTGGTPALNANKFVKIGVRDKFEMISVRSGSSQWDGAAILFAEALARKLNSEAQFVELPNVPKCLSAVKYKMVDASISLISYTDERAKTNYLSDPYFETGIVGASLNLLTLKKANGSGFNAPEFTAIVAKGTTAEALVRKMFSKMKVKVVNKTSDVYEEAKRIESQTEQGKFSGAVMITDEVIAMTWPGSYVVEHNGKRLYSSDKYVAVAQTSDIRDAINAVIREDNIAGMYKELVGR